ncbi:Methyl-accepting chemotaxis protein McpB [Methylobacterium bullatum]|uniref:histidine kinase n=1 Tax=Methylobacterium bullatum TaxID=570505 RepID=A0A679J2S6_9HYPH|nr:Methyl-accepting chemotaxis protein McpB [Methylobacterium bullatum]
MLDADAFLQNLSSRIDGFMYSGLNNADYNMTYLSDGFERLLGYDVASFLRNGTSFSSLIHADDLPAVDAAVGAALSASARWQISYRVKTAGGRWKHVLETGGGRADAAGEIAYLDGIVIDFGRANDLADRIQSGQAALDAIDRASDQMIEMLRSLKMLSLNARIEAARSGEAGAGFGVVAKEMGQLAALGDDVTKAVGTELGHLKSALRL